MTDSEKNALDVVARHVLHRMAQDADDTWSYYYDISEHDWREIQKRVAALARMPHPAIYRAAYETLTERAA